MLQKIVNYVLVTLILTSCSFNKMFHKPAKMGYSIEKMNYVVVGEDKTFVEFDGISREVTLKDSNKDIINADYTITDCFFESTTGNNLNGWLMSPNDTEPKATIVHFHGSAGNLFVHHRIAKPLVEKGFQVFAFDYSGYGYSEGKAKRNTVLADAYSALDHVHRKVVGEEQKCVLYGQSYGGYLAGIVGANRQDQIDGIVIEGAFSSHKEEAKYEVPFWGGLVKEGIVVAKEIKKNTKPLLIVHSSEDEKVPLMFGREIFEKANNPKEFYEIEEAHISGLQYYADEIAEKIADMIK